MSGLAGLYEKEMFSKATRPRGPFDVVRARLGSTRLLGRVEQLEDPLGRRDARLQHVEHRRQLGERLGELARVLDERLHVTERHGTRRDPQTTEHRDGDEVEVAEEHHRRLDDAGDELRRVARLVQLFVLLAEALLDGASAGRTP